MTTRRTKAEATDTTTDAEAGDAHASVPDAAATAADTGDATPDLANVDVPAVEGATGTIIDGPIDVDDAVELPELPELGNAKPDVAVTAVRNAHGTWTWTARATEDDRELAQGGPHYEDRLHENLELLFNGKTVALRRTGDDKVRRLT